MAYDKFDASDGVWRTVGGRRIFIKGGQDLASAMKESGKFKLSKKKENKYQKLTGAEEDGLAGLYGKKFDTPEDLASAVQMERNNRIGDFEAELDRMEEEGQNVSMYKEKGWDDEVNYNELVEKIKNNPSQFEQYLNKQEDKVDYSHDKQLAENAYKKFNGDDKEYTKYMKSEYGWSKEDAEKFKPKESEVNSSKDYLERDYQKLKNNPMIGAREHWSDAYYNEVKDYGEKAKESEKTTDENKRYNTNPEYQRAENGGYEVQVGKEKYYYNTLDELKEDWGTAEEVEQVKSQREKTLKNNREFSDYSENLDLSKANDRFLAKSYALYDRDNGKISDEEYQKKLKEIDSHAGEKSSSKNSVDDRIVIEKDNGSVYAKPGRRWEILEKDKSAYGKEIYKVRDEKGNVQWKPASDFYDNNSKNNDWVRNAFNQYKKDHPNTKMTLQDFMKNNKK